MTNYKDMTKEEVIAFLKDRIAEEKQELLEVTRDLKR